MTPSLTFAFACCVCWLVLQLPTTHAMKYYSCTDAIRRNASYKPVVLAFPTIPDYNPINITDKDCTLSGPLCGGDLVMHRYGDSTYRFNYTLTAQGPRNDIVYVVYSAATVEENRPTTIQLTLECSTAQPSVTQLSGDCFGEKTTLISGTLLTAGGCVGLQTQTMEQSPSDTLSNTAALSASKRLTGSAELTRTHTPVLTGSLPKTPSHPISRTHTVIQTLSRVISRSRTVNPTESKRISRSHTWTVFSLTLSRSRSGVLTVSPRESRTHTLTRQLPHCHVLGRRWSR